MINWITVTEYSRRRNISRSRINRMIQNGELEVIRDNSRFLVKIEEHEDIQEKVVEKIEALEEKLEILCKHLGLSSRGISK